MKLETAGRGEFANPSPEQIRSELSNLDTSGNDFATLSDQRGFIQTARGPAGYMLEYRDASGYFGSRDEAIPLADVQEAFGLYLSGDASWRGRFAWERRGDVAPDTGTTGRATASAGDNPVDSLVNTVKNEAVRLAKNRLRGLFRR